MTLFPFLILIGVGLVLAFPVIAIIASFMFRVVVATNMVPSFNHRKRPYHMVLVRKLATRIIAGQAGYPLLVFRPLNCR
jgi:hypothetical protein